MKKYRIGLIALCLAVTVLFSGCAGLVQQVAQSLIAQEEIVRYKDMEYTRPALQSLDQALEDACAVAAEGKDVEQVMDAVYAFYDVYDRYYTDFALADIRYSTDLTDTYWEQEYQFCTENAAAADAALDALYYALADSPLRQELENEEYFGPGYFDAYEGESIWDETFTDLMEQEAQLQNRYYELSSQAAETEYYSEEYFNTYGIQMAELFVELIALRQQIAAYAGYDSYPQFAYDMYHYRDFTPEQADAYLQEIGETLSESYRKINTGSVWDLFQEPCSETQTFRYVKTAAQNMGGDIADAFDLLEEAGLYNIAYSENKYDSSYEVYLWSYYEPYIFMSPYLDPSDQLVFAHEFGHFVNDYVCWGSYAGTDVAEVHSQAMEYLALCYAEPDAELENYKLADTLCTYTEQAAYALFEQRVYGLTGEELTVENVQKLYEEICLDFGFDSWGWDSRDYVAITHFYTSPMYIVSYVVSCDLAFQIYQLEKATPGAGLEVYEECVYSMDTFLLTFAETYGLESPFAKGRLEQVKATLEEGLDEYL